jgi:hypothetical protein
LGGGGWLIWARLVGVAATCDGCCSPSPDLQHIASLTQLDRQARVTIPPPPHTPTHPHHPPVGPRNRKEAMGPLGSFMPALLRWMAWATASTASSCPMMRLRARFGRGRALQHCSSGSICDRVEQRLLPLHRSSPAALEPPQLAQLPGHRRSTRAARERRRKPAQAGPGTPARSKAWSGPPTCAAPGPGAAACRARSPPAWSGGCRSSD